MNVNNPINFWLGQGIIYLWSWAQRPLAWPPQVGFHFLDLGILQPPLLWPSLSPSPAQRSTSFSSELLCHSKSSETVLNTIPSTKEFTLCNDQSDNYHIPQWYDQGSYWQQTAEGPAASSSLILLQRLVLQGTSEKRKEGNLRVIKYQNILRIEAHFGENES